MRYTFRQLEYFVAAGETESVRLAAARMNISQTSISSAIAHLELELGAPLFIRDHRQGLTLTAFGRGVLRQARRLLEEGECLHRLAAATNARLGAEERDARLEGTFSIACFPTLAPLVLPELMRGFREIHPGLQLEILVIQQEDVVTALRDRTAQAAITFGLQIPQDIAFSRLATLAPLVWVGESHPLSAASAIDLEDLAAADLILHDVPLLRDYVLAMFREQGLTPRIAIRSPHVEFVSSLVANGCGYTLAGTSPRCELAADGRRILRKPLSGNHAAIQLGVATVAATAESGAQAAFHKHCRTVISDFYVPGMVASALDRRPAPMARPPRSALKSSGGY